MSYVWNKKSLCTYDVDSFPGFFTLPYCPGPHRSRPLVRTQQWQGVPPKAFVWRRTGPNIALYLSYLLLKPKKYYTTLFTVQNIFLFISVKFCTRLLYIYIHNFVVWSEHAGKKFKIVSKKCHKNRELTKNAKLKLVIGMLTKFFFLLQTPLSKVFKKLIFVIHTIRVL